MKHVTNEPAVPSDSYLNMAGISKASYDAWRAQFVEGAPKSVDPAFPVEALKALGMIGLYEKEQSE